MEAPALFLLHILFYSASPFYFGTLKGTVRSAAFFVYLGLLVAFANFLGDAYSLQLTEDIFISSGTFAYCGLFTAAVLFLVTESNLATLRSVIWLVILVDVFVFVLVRLLGSVLEGSDADPARISIPGASLAFILAGTSLFILELLAFLAISEKAKQYTKKPAGFAAASVVAFIAILCGDQIFFPMLLATFSDSHLQLAVGDFAGRFLIAVSFGTAIFLYMSLFPSEVKRSMRTSLHLTELFNQTAKPLRDELERQRQFLELNEQQLRDLAQRLSLSAAAAQMGVWEYDGRTEAMVWDDRAGEICGLPPGSFDGKFATWVSLVHPDDRKKVLDHASQLVPDSDPSSILFRVLHADGSVRHLEAHSLSRRKQDQNLHLTGVVRDVTDRIALEEEHARLEQQLHQTQKMESIGQFAGGIAHDFNNLLIPILGYSELNLEVVDKNSTLHGDLKEIQKAAYRAQSLIEQLLAFGRQQVLETTGVDLNNLVRNVTAILTRLVDENIRLEVELANDVPPILADSGQLEQLLLNLVANARDAMPNGGTLKICTERVQLDARFVAEHPDAQLGSHSMVTVTDDGVGIDPDSIPRIFEPFFTTKSRHKGTGLGLASVYGIVKQHKGIVWLDSEQGKGSSFYVCFPEFDGPVPDIEEPLDEAVPTGGHETILVVEDDHSVRQTICRTLRDHGYTVLEAEKPSIALDENLTDFRSADLLITDMIMPGMSGAEMAKQLTALHPNLKTLFISGYTGGQTMEARSFLKKPFLGTELLRKVRRCLD